MARGSRRAVKGSLLLHTTVNWLLHAGGSNRACKERNSGLQVNANSHSSKPTSLNLISNQQTITQISHTATWQRQLTYVNTAFVEPRVCNNNSATEVQAQPEVSTFHLRREVAAIRMPTPTQTPPTISFLPHVPNGLPLA